MTNLFEYKDGVVKIEKRFDDLIIYRRIGDKKIAEKHKVNNFYFKKSDTGKYETLFGDKVDKIEYRGFTNDEYYNPDTFECDIKLNEHYSILLARQNLIKRQNPYRILFFDLETNGSIDTINTPKEIISVVSYDSFSNEYKFWYFKFEGEVDNVKSFSTEKEMLQNFVNYMNDFDVITAWNGIKFDFPYLINRCKLLGVNIDAYVKGGGKTTGQIRTELKSYFNGINSIDLLVVFMKIAEWLPVRPPDYRLETIARVFLENTLKLAIEVSPGQLWTQKRFSELEEYNIQDVKVMVELDKRYGLFTFINITQDLVQGLNAEELPYNSRIIDNYLMCKYDKVFPTKRKITNTDFVVSGAEVLEPVPGFHKYVGILDFSGMYQNIIRTFNISPDTISKDGNIKINNICFDDSRDGILVSLVKELIDLRKKYKTLKLNINENDPDYKNLFFKELCIKKITNSVYGVFGYSGFRLYNPDVANSITFTGRQLIHFVKDKVTELSNEFNVIYGDTDSVFLELKNKDVNDFETADKMFNDIVNKLNDSLYEFVLKYSNDTVAKKHTLDIEYETLFTKMIMTSAKKRYVGLVRKSKGKIFQNEQLYFKGIELTRKDTPIGIKAILLEMINSYFNTLSVDEMLKLVKKSKTELKNMKTEDFIMNKNLTHEIDEYKVLPQHARAAKYSNENFGTKFSKENYKGGQVYVKVVSNYPQTDVIFLEPNMEIPKGIVINYDKYFNNFILEKIKLIFGEDIYKQIDLKMSGQKSIFDYNIQKE